MNFTDLIINNNIKKLGKNYFGNNELKELTIPDSIIKSSFFI